MNKRAITTLGTLLTVASASASMTLPAHATTKTANKPHQVTICHANNSATGASGNQPYVRITVDVNSIVHGAGHDSHEGPVATSLTVAQQLKDSHTKWGDIIPPIPAANYPGTNWTTESQIIYNHTCSCLTGTNQVTPSTTVTDKKETPKPKNTIAVPAGGVAIAAISTPTAAAAPSVTELPHTGMSNILLTTLVLGAITALTTAGGARLRTLFLQQ